MGWTFCDDWQTKAQCIKGMLGNSKVIAQRSTSLGFYAVIDGPTERYILVALLQRSGGSYGYKDMDESMGPYGAVDCPLAFFELVPEPSNKFATEWRAKVRAHHAAKLARKGKQRMIIVGKKCRGEILAVALCKPIRNSKRRVSVIDLAKLDAVNGTYVNLGEHYA